jgi:hypothetical protein
LKIGPDKQGLRNNKYSYHRRTYQPRIPNLDVYARAAAKYQVYRPFSGDRRGG